MNATTSTRRRRTVRVSAPGKVLVSGGYLVLDPSHSGLVLAVDKRFYATAEAEFFVAAESHDGVYGCDNPPGSPARKGRNNAVAIRVDSPQYGESYHYEFQTDALELVDAAVPRGSPHKNDFVRQTLYVCLLYLAPHLRQPLPGSGVSHLHLTLQGDNEFWSHPSPSASSSSRRPPSDIGEATKVEARPDRKFLPAPRDEAGRVCKTGLGSSACLVTSLAAALYHLLVVEGDATATKTNGANAFASTSTSTIERIANLAQLCHCRAQGKVGSGFDVSAACWGSHVYRRFDPRGADVGAMPGSREEVGGEEAARRLREAVDGPLTRGCVHRALTAAGDGPVQVVLADPARGHGSSSPGLSRCVWKHRDSVPWREMEATNKAIIEAWLQLSDAHAAAPLADDEFEELARTAAGEWNHVSQSPDRPWPEGSARIAQLLLSLSVLFGRWRRAFRALGLLAGVELEPDAQKVLADATAALPGVVAAVVPGAGGDDALACLYLDRPAVRERISAFWASQGVATLDVRAVSYGEGIVVHSAGNAEAFRRLAPDRSQCS